MSTKVKYNDSTLFVIADGQSAVLACEGIKLKGDIKVISSGDDDGSYAEGYEEGKADGREAGYTEGFNAAVAITNDATATAETIYSGYTAYVKGGEKVVGEAKTYDDGVLQGRNEANEEFEEFYEEIETAINELNTELENNIYGEVRGNDPGDNLQQVYSDFGAIKESITSKGVEVADGTPTAEYADKVGEVFEKGKSEGGGGGSYEQGFADGKASVKHITFSTYLPSNYDPENERSYFCCFSGMTWREYVDSDMSNGLFIIKDEKAFYQPNVWIDYYLGCDADDVIIEKMEYNLLIDVLYRDEAFYVFRSVNMGENLNLYNQDGYYIDDRGFIRTTDGRLLLAGEAMGGCWIVKATEYPDTEMYTYTLTPDTDLIIFHLGDYDTAVKRGFTWDEFCGSAYANYSYHVSDDTITTEWGGIVQLNGVNVKPDDVIIEGAEYETVY